MVGTRAQRLARARARISKRTAFLAKGAMGEKEPRRIRERGARHTNIMAARILARCIKSSLGPLGMDKMLIDDLGIATITNDGATILNEMHILHPAAKVMVEAAKTTDQEVGDGTKSAVVLAGELLSRAEDLLDKQVHPTTVMNGYEKAASKALEFYGKIAISTKPFDKEMLKKIAMTSMAGRVVSESKDHFANIAAEAVMKVAQKIGEGDPIDLDEVKFEKKTGESMTQAELIEGVIVDKEIIAHRSDMPKRVENAKIALLYCPLEIQKTEYSSKIDIERPEQITAFLNEEQRMIREMVEKIAALGAKVVISHKAIDEVARGYLRRHNILAVQMAKPSDMKKLVKATGGKTAIVIDDLEPEDLGYAKLVEERRFGEDRLLFIEGCKNPRTISILIRGGTEKILDEVERSIHDALSVVKNVIQNPKVVAGGGAPEAEVAARLRRWAEQLSGKEQLAALSFAEALEAIPITLAENAGLDPIDVFVELRARHSKGDIWSGVDVFEGKVKDMAELDVYEPLAVKEQVVKSASEATSMILKIDDVIAAKLDMEPRGPEQPEEE